MSTQVNPQVNPDTNVENQPTTQGVPQQGPDRRLIGAIALLVFGVLALLATLINSSILGMSILLAIGVLFIVWGLVARVPGLMIPGGIMTGLGVGILLSQAAFPNVSGETDGGIIVLCLGLGFLLIIPLIAIISPERHWWALIPGGILAFIGLALIVGGPALSALDVIGRFWPVIPIVAGLILIWQILRKR